MGCAPLIGGRLSRNLPDCDGERRIAAVGLPLTPLAAREGIAVRVFPPLRGFLVHFCLQYLGLVAPIRRSRGCSRPRSRFAAQVEDAAEHVARHSNLDLVEDGVTRVGDELRADLYQLLGNSGRRPAFRLVGQGRGAREAWTGCRPGREAASVARHRAAGQAGPLHRVAALLDPLVRRAALIVEGDQTLTVRTALSAVSVDTAGSAAGACARPSRSGQGHHPVPGMHAVPHPR